MNAHDSTIEALRVRHCEFMLDQQLKPARVRVRCGNSHEVGRERQCRLQADHGMRIPFGQLASPFVGNRGGVAEVAWTPASSAHQAT